MTLFKYLMFVIAILSFVYVSNMDYEDEQMFSKYHNIKPY